MTDLKRIAAMIESARVTLRKHNNAADQTAEKRIQFFADCDCGAYEEPHMMGTGRCHRESAEDKRRRVAAYRRSFDEMIADPKKVYRAQARRNEP